MATPNYGYEKRQRELAKKRKKEEKAQRKTLPGGGSDAPDAPDNEGEAPAEPGTTGGTEPGPTP